MFENDTRRQQHQAATHISVNSGAHSNAMLSTSICKVFFSLKGTLPRQHWYLAILCVASILISGASLSVGDRNYIAAPPTQSISAWLLPLWCFAHLLVATLLCAKRLLNCHRPVWLALTILIPGFLLTLAFATNVDVAWPSLTAMAVHSVVFAVPALIACACYDAAD